MKFENVRLDICKKIYGEPNNLSRLYIIIEGFINLSVTDEIAKVVYGGTLMPVIACVHKKTGQTLFFNVHALLEDQN